MIETVAVRLGKDVVTHARDVPEHLEREFGGRLLRWFISAASKDAWLLDVTLLDSNREPPEQARPAPASGFQSVAVNLIPTGVGCETGGFAGDAAPACALLASCVDYLVTNPNAVNASNYYHGGDNLVYTEGYFLDAFATGRHPLYLPVKNKIGVILERGRSDDDGVRRAYDIINAARAVHGVDIVGVEEIDSLGGRFVRLPNGVSSGTLENPQVLLRAASALVEKGANALAVTSVVGDLPDEAYRLHLNGSGPNPVGGLEAIISHLVSSQFELPCAHAPLVNFTPSGAISVADARAAGEAASSSGLACVLMGLDAAPSCRRLPATPYRNALASGQIIAVIAPATALGSAPVLHADRCGTPVIAVADNGTILDVSAEELGLNKVFNAASYFEAAGMLLALTRGISTDSVARPLATLKPHADGYA